METIKCLRCGKCCYYMMNGIKKKCKYLIQITENKATCRIYKSNTRLNRYIDTGIRCTFRIQSPDSFVGCPYNKNAHASKDINTNKPMLNMKQSDNLLISLFPS
jgi:hypothetical protein